MPPHGPTWKTEEDTISFVLFAAAIRSTLTCLLNSATFAYHNLLELLVVTDIDDDNPNIVGVNTLASRATQ